MKNFKFLQTDFYQISMGFAYIINGINTRKSAFEGFIRHVKPSVNPSKDFYIFDGEDEIHEYIATIRKELQDPELLDTFIELIEPKITSPFKLELIETFRQNWKTIDTDFKYSVVPNGTLVFPLVPVFQFYGDTFIGQMIETYVTNTYNGKTGLATIKYLKENLKPVFLDDAEMALVDGIINEEQVALNDYAVFLDEAAAAFRNSTDKILLEAAFRRAPNKVTADMASNIALINGWNGTSNVTMLLTGVCDASKVNGTMAHSWVMAFETEEEAFIAWDKIFPGTTFLIDTYHVITAAKLIKRLVLEGKITKPKDVRIDSDPIEEYAIVVDQIFEGMGIAIYLSGDMEPEKFEHFEFMNIPYDKAMAGTKYVYANMIVDKLNCGFVYKLVQFEKDGKLIRPEKKASGKKNYPGLKTCSYNPATDTLSVNYNITDGAMGFENMDKIKPTTKVEFI